MNNKNNGLQKTRSVKRAESNQIAISSKFDQSSRIDLNEMSIYMYKVPILGVKSKVMRLPRFVIFLFLLYLIKIQQFIQNSPKHDFRIIIQIKKINKI